MNDHFKAFMYRLFGPSEAHAHFQLFFADGQKDFRYASINHLLGQPQGGDANNFTPARTREYFDRMRALSEGVDSGNPCKISVTPHPCQRSDWYLIEDHITELGCFFVDADAGHITPELITEYHLPPTMVVESSPEKYHLYWCLIAPLPATAENRQLFKSIQEGLANDFGLEVWMPLRQVMAVPGMKNTKYTNVDVWLEYHDGPLYSPSEIERFPRVHRKTARIELPDGWQVSQREGEQDITDSIITFLDTHAHEGNRDRATYRAACWMRDAGWSESQIEVALINHGCGGFGIREIQNKIRAAFNHADRRSASYRHATY